MSDQVQLDIQVTGQPAVDKLADSVSTLKGLVKVLDEELANGTIGTSEYIKEMGKLNAAIKQQETAQGRLKERDEELREETRKLREETERLRLEDEKLAQSAENTRVATGKTAQGILDISRAGQDFAQGGFGGVINNLEGVGRAIGNFSKLGIGEIGAALLSPTGLAAGLMAVGTAAYASWPHIKKWFDGLDEETKSWFVDLDEQNKKAAGHFKTVEDSLEALGKKIEEIKKKEYTSADNTKDMNHQKLYNQLLGQQVDLEKEITANKKAQSDYQELMNRPTAVQMAQEKSGETKRRKEALEKIPKEQMEGVRRDVIAGIERTSGLSEMVAEEKEMREALKDMQNTRKLSLQQLTDMEHQLPKLQAQIATVRKEAPERAEKLMAGMKGGEREGVERVLAAMLRDTESYKALLRLSGEGMAEEGIRERDQRFKNIGGILGDFGRKARAKIEKDARAKKSKDIDEEYDYQNEKLTISNADWEKYKAKKKQHDAKVKHNADKKRNEAKQAVAKAEHERKAAESKATQFREESGRDFEKFEKIPGFMGLDVVAAKYAGVPRGGRGQFEQTLREHAAEALRMQHAQMPEEEVQRRAAQYPAFLQQRYKGMRAEAVGAARMQGIDLGAVAQSEGLSKEALISNTVANQAMLNALQKSNQALEHLSRQNRQTVTNIGRMNTRTTSPLHANSPE